ncbi:MAG: deoxynucleoside kinase [Rhodospirillales bacterium]|nr:deoxynucleoside kinase [Rhodospirillales bacterium]
MKRIEICGGIASGKTTLARLFEIDEFGSVFENFKSNPFWEIFYKSPPSYAFETEVTFTLQHYHQIKIASAPRNGTVVSDYSSVLDLAYAHVSLSGRQLETYLSVHGQVVSEIGQPDLLVHLQCGADELLRRIRNRNRSEEAAMTVEFLEDLNASLNERVEEFSAAGQKIVSIDSEACNFADNAEEAARVVSEITNSL